MTTTTDVVIIGAGPAGSGAAIALAQRGRNVVLIDKATFPRDKCCGDGLTTGALRELELLGCNPTALPSWCAINGLSVRSPSGRIAEVPLRSDGYFGGVIRRIDLDARLVERARECGVDVREGIAFTGLDAADNTSTVTAHFNDGSSLTTSTLIAADGAHSVVRKTIDGDATASMQTTNSKNEWFAYRTYVDNVTNAEARKLWVMFEQSVLPGYVWSFPIANNVVNLGVCFMRSPHERGAALADKWKEVLDSSFVASLLGPNARVQTPVRAWPIPARISRELLTAKDGRILFIGDAAHAADPMTGEGISQALQSARVVADAITTSELGTPEEIAASYITAIEHGLQREHRIAHVCSAMLARSFLARGAVRISGFNATTALAVGRWLYEDYPHAAMFQPTQWRSIFTHARGPFAELHSKDAN